MMKLVVLILALVGAQAFVPVTPASRAAVALKGANVEDMVGVGPETGNVVWDPMGFGSVSKVITGEHTSVMPDVEWLREAEIKHGRAAMLAFVGTLTAMQGITFPGSLGGYYYEAGPWYDGLASAFKTNSFGMLQLLFAIGAIEGTAFPAGFWTGEGTREPGDYGFMPFGDATKFNKDPKELQLNELKNGRLAMIAMAAFFAQHQIPGSVPLLPQM